MLSLISSLWLATNLAQSFGMVDRVAYPTSVGLATQAYAYSLVGLRLGNGHSYLNIGPVADSLWVSPLPFHTWSEPSSSN